MTYPNLRRLCAALAASLLLSASVPASAHRVDASEASALSLLPLAVVVSAPATLLAGGALLTVVAVESTARASVWVLERASDGARATVELGAAGVECARGAQGQFHAALDGRDLGRPRVTRTAGLGLCSAQGHSQGQHQSPRRAPSCGRSLLRRAHRVTRSWWSSAAPISLGTKAIA